MGQANDNTRANQELEETPAEDAGGLWCAAVAIDPPRNGALGIRDLLELLEKEVGRGFPADPDRLPETKMQIPRPRA